MKSKSKSLKLSIAFTTFFAILLAFLTLTAPWSVEIICEYFHRARLTNFLIVVTYLAVPAGWGAILLLYKILFNVNKKIIFVKENVKYLQILSWLCFYVGVLSAFSTVKFIAFAIVSLSALFIGLIVRVVRNIIHKAIQIKEENELTI